LLTVIAGSESDAAIRAGAARNFWIISLTLAMTERDLHAASKHHPEKEKTPVGSGRFQ
jgi:hypothetical protein